LRGRHERNDGKCRKRKKARLHGGILASTSAATAVACLLCGCGAGKHPGTWPLPNGDLAGTRAASGSSIFAGTVARLRVQWRFRFTMRPSSSGSFASTPVADHDTVYVQDLRSNVFALDRSTGALRWARRFRARNDGPNGLALDSERVYGATDDEAFALSASTGKKLWRRHLTSRSEQFVDVAPVVWKSLVFVSTVGYAPFGRGTIYALDAGTGTVRWKFVTIEHPWPHPLEAGGGGLWYPVSVDARARLYAGNSNPTPWGGTPKRPNGAAFPGPVPYTDSLLVLDARTGRLLWHDQVTPHDVRDYDFEATPILATLDGTDLVLGAGKAGRVIAWNRDTRQRRWSAVVGLHRNDVGPLPRRRVTVCPGLLGGVETPMAYADGRLFVPVVDLCGWGSAVAQQKLTSVDPSRGRGRLVALDAMTGRTLWERRLPAPDFGCATIANDIVFTSTYDGTVYALAARGGEILWRTRMRAGVNACPAVVGDLLLVGAGIRRPSGAAPELVAFGLG
jgi:outer membrane protein assembly factor BamB